MVRSLFSALFRRAQRQIAPATTAAVPRFVPTMQSLEVREVPAVLGLFATTDTVPVASADGGYDTTSAKIRLSDILISSYSTKSSPGMMM